MVVVEAAVAVAVAEPASVAVVEAYAPTPLGVVELA